MQVYVKTKILFGLIFILGYVQAQAAPLLNGIAIHQELGQELFMGALYSESLSNDANTLLGSELSMRMELKILAPDGIATRRFSRMWIESMAINSKADFLTAQADNMVQFDSLFKGRLLYGDKIVFNSTPGAGVSIVVDGVTLGTIKDNKFFTMLLSTWIGRIPLASDFKQDLLKMGDVSTDLGSRYEELNPTNSRRNEIMGWTGKTAIADTKADTKEKAKQELAQSAPPEKSQPKERTTTTIKPELPDLSLSPATIAKPDLDLPKLTDSSKPQPQQPVAISTPASTPASSSAPTKPAVTTPAASAVSKVADDDEEDGPALTAQSLLARQFYVSDSLAKVNRVIKYPRRAQERNQEGSVRIAVTVDRQGNILGLSRVEESKFETLNKAAEEAISQAAPFPALPPAVPGTRFQFTVPFRFTLPK